MRNTNLLAAQICALGVWLLSSQCTQAFYNPSTGRWLSRDPVENEMGTLNSFSFVENQPVSFVDKLGLFTFYGIDIVSGVANSDGRIGPGAGAFGNTHWSSGVSRIKVKVTCGLCCLEDVDFYLRLKVAVPLIGDDIDRGITGGKVFATAARVANISNHEGVHVQHSLALAETMFPIVEGCCKGRCWKGSWNHMKCYDFLLKKMKAYDEQITGWNMELSQDWHAIHFAKPGGRQSYDIPITDKMGTDFQAVQDRKISSWGNTEFCGDGGYY